MIRNWLYSILLIFISIGLKAQVTTDTIMMVLTDNCGYQLEVSIQNPTCQGINDGYIEINSENGNVLSYSWLNTTADSNVAEGLTEGNYQALLSGPNCTDTLSFDLENKFTIEAPDIYENFCGEGGFVDLLDGVMTDGTVFSFVVETVYGTPIECVNCPDATATFFDQTSFVLVHITDANGCTVTRKVFVTVLESLSVNVANVIDDSCNSNGAFSIEVSGGTGAYYYSLDGGDNLQTDPNFTDVSGGQLFTVDVFDQNAGCSETIDVMIPLAYTLPDYEFTVEEPGCFGEDSGAIIGNPVSTTDVYQYTLEPGNDVSLQNNATFLNLTSGLYTVYAVAENGQQCITPLANLEIGSPDPLDLTENVTGPDCPGGGGDVEFLVNGQNGEFLFSIDGENYLPQNIWMEIPPGLYTGYVQNNEGCIDSSEFVIEALLGPEIEITTIACCPGTATGIVIVESGKLFTGGDYTFSLDSMVWQGDNFFENLLPGPDTMFIQDPDGCILIVPFYIPQALRPELEMDVGNINCPEEANGSINVEVINGGPSEDYTYALEGDAFQESGFFEGLGPGIYPLLVMDSVPCIHDYLFEIEEPDGWELTFEAMGPSCSGISDGSVIIHVEGGTPPYLFAIDGGPFQTDSLFTGLSGGNHDVLIQDLEDCTYTEMIFIESPDELLLEVTIIDESCDNHNGAIVCHASGGNFPYQYLWNTGDTTANLINVVEGIYALTVTDVEGCEKTITAEVHNLDGPNLWANLIDVECSGAETGKIDLHVASGSPPFVYTWSNGAYSQDIEDLEAGNYLVTVTDIHFCASSKSFTIHEPEPIHLNYQSGQAGDYWFINLIVEGGTPPYSYEWSNGETTEDIFNLMPGQYTVTVTDDHGCEKSLEITIGVNTVGEPEWAGSLNLFPNPVEDVLNIELTLFQEQPFQISIFNANGQLMIQRRFWETEEVYRLLINDLSQGGYLVAIEIGSEMVVRKIVVK